MAPKEKQMPHWDREQVAPDGPDQPLDEQGQTWNRNEWLPDRGEEDERAQHVRPTKDADESGEPSGHGMPSGESHWQRNDPTD